MVVLQLMVKDMLVALTLVHTRILLVAVVVLVKKENHLMEAMVRATTSLEY